MTDGNERSDGLDWRSTHTIQGTGIDTERRWLLVGQICVLRPHTMLRLGLQIGSEAIVLDQFAATQLVAALDTTRRQLNRWGSW